MNGTHYFEAFRFLCDEEPVAVSAWFDNEVLANPRGERFVTARVAYVSPQNTVGFTWLTVGHIIGSGYLHEPSGQNNRG